MSVHDDVVQLLATRRHWFFDLDGTLYLGGGLLPGALDLIEELRRRGVGYTFLTNNSSRSSREYESRLASLGVPLGSGGVLTSGRATGLWLHEELPDARTFLLGTPSLATELAELGAHLVEDAPDVVVIGYDTTLDYPRLSRACLHLRDGARYLLTHPDLNCPSPEGPLPDAGSFAALIEASTGRTPDLILGKPNVDLLVQAALAVDVDLRDCIMVGDRIETDMTMARDAGAAAMLVLTGVTDASDPRLEEADWLHVAADVAELHAHLNDAA